MDRIWDFAVVGAGIFGISAAIELRLRGHRVCILDDGTIPNPMAASTDISKIIRMEYGSDRLYMDMADECIDQWKNWNDVLGEEIYHEVGFLLACRNPLESEEQSFEKASWDLLHKRGYRPVRVKTDDYALYYPAFNNSIYPDGFYHARAGYARSGRAVVLLADYARSLGVHVIENTKVASLSLDSKEQIVRTLSGTVKSGHVVVCAGAMTSYLVPELKPYMRVTGHPVFHIKPSQPDLFIPPRFPVFAADISNTGWYGFPLDPAQGIVKLANHGIGKELHPENDDRIVSQEDFINLGKFLSNTFPSLVNDPVVYTRRCLYSDTLDGHFWIDRHPAESGLTIGSGGSGHGFKMGPAMGRMIADAAEGLTGRIPERFRWRHIHPRASGEEEARHRKN